MNKSFRGHRILWVLKQAVHTPSKHDSVVVLYGRKVFESCWNGWNALSKRDLSAFVVVKIGQNDGLCVRHVQVHILPLKEKGLQDLGKVHIVCILAKCLKFDAFKLIHVHEDHYKVLTQELHYL